MCAHAPLPEKIVFVRVPDGSSDRAKAARHMITDLKMNIYRQLAAPIASEDIARKEYLQVANSLPNHIREAGILGH